MKVLIVVDMQNDFCSANGSLSSIQARMVVPKVCQFIKDNVYDKTALILTRDTHDANYLATNEGLRLPVEHCMFESWGWNLHSQVVDTMVEVTDKGLIPPEIIDKGTFGSGELMLRLAELDDTYGVEEIVFCGVCTDICVIANATLAKTYFPETTIKVIKDACAGSTPEAHNTALTVMNSLQIEVI